MQLRWILLLLPILFFVACKKEKTVTFTGQLLLSQKYPMPLANRQIQLYQAGSPPAIGLPAFSRAASASGTTGADGFFRVSFTPGKSMFLIFSGTNGQPLTLSSDYADTSFPRFSRTGFPDSGYDATKPIFIGKTIDTAIIKVSLSSNLAATDTIGFRATIINGAVDKEYTGMTGNAGEVIILDTIYNLLFTSYDGYRKSYNNDVYAGRKTTYGGGYPTIVSHGVNWPLTISTTDEDRQEIMFYFKK